jgi:hypothetical protein
MVQVLRVRMGLEPNPKSSYPVRVGFLRVISGLGFFLSRFCSVGLVCVGSKMLDEFTLGRQQGNLISVAFGGCQIQAADRVDRWNQL